MRDQKNNQPIVPVQLLDQKTNEITHPKTSFKDKLAIKIQVADIEVNIFNSVDKYILYALLKELKIHDH